MKKQQPENLEDRLRRAQALRERGEGEEAARHYRDLANLLAQRERWELAERCYAASCQIQPGDAVAQHNWGVTLVELGRPADAIAAYERAIGLNPAYANAYCSLGLAYQRIAAPEAALVAFDCAMKLAPQEARFALEHARTRVNLGQYADALGELESLAPRSSRNPEVFNLKGLALKNLKRASEALSAFDAAIALQPSYAEALSNRGNLRLQMRQFSRAIEDLNAAVAVKPTLDWLRGTRLYAASHAFEWNAYESERAAVIDGVRSQAKIIQPLALQTLVDDPALQQQAARLWTQASCPPLRAATTAAHEPVSDKIRIAYVSRDFKSHPVSFLIAEVIELHDRERFEVIAVNYGAASDDPMQVRLRAAFDGFLDVEHLTDAAIAELCRNLAVDIAVDLSGFTDGARSAIFAWRAAPVQVAYLGYLGTSGTRLYDYLIADAQIIPPDSRPFYDENIVQLPSYQANDRHRPTPMPASRSPLDLPEAGFVFCCFNNPCKITPEVFASWMRILAAVPGSVLWLLDEDGQAPSNARAHAQTHGIDPARLVFANRADRETYLANLGAADLFLDTLPYNAGTTASDALWMGLPVLTRPGRSFPGRVAASLLQAIELPELIAESMDAYEMLAIQLAQEPERMADIKRRLLASRQSSCLFDARSFTRNLEIAYVEMQRIHAAAEGSRDIVVSNRAGHA
ncbi:MAG TPA: tetratricopeptide repeat protein [Burkholderiaceae bacterium]